MLDVTALLYRSGMTTRNPLRISEARKRLSQLVERVAQGGAPVAIGRYGRERAILVSAEEYGAPENTAEACEPDSRRNPYSSLQSAGSDR